MSIGRMIVFVRPELGEGPILAADGEFLHEVHVAGWDLSDHDATRPADTGLQVFEGYVEHGPGPDPDVYLRGEWRWMTAMEMLRFGRGTLPWTVTP